MAARLHYTIASPREPIIIQSGLNRVSHKDKFKCIVIWHIHPCAVFSFQAGNTKVCDLVEEALDKIKKFRFRKEKTIGAIICKNYIYKLVNIAFSFFTVAR